MMEDTSKDELLAKIREEIQFLESNPQVYITERIALLKQLIKEKEDTKPQNPGNITMKQHLQNLLTECEETPDTVISNRLLELKDAEEFLTQAGD